METFNASPNTITQSLQICELENETGSEMGGGGRGRRKGERATMRRIERVFLQQKEEEAYSVGFVHI